MIYVSRYIFFALIIIHKENRAVPDDDFRPTPIPLDKWQDDREGNSGTLQEIVKTVSPETVAAIPAHYWEDALRHSVYLTLVRDKIDELIARSAVKSENSKTEPIAKEDDDRDMWEKIKSAPFDRLVHETTAPIGDISILAKGRLLEQNGGYKFTEDETTKEKCVDEKCMQGVKAYWSVKRVRQRDAETHPGKYHYELTFSVISKPLQKEKKTNNNSVRTFTVRESSPRNPDPINNGHRHQRAVWVHKNIVPPKYHNNHPRNQGLERFFSSLFSDEDTLDLPKYKQQNAFVQQRFPQLSKVGNIGNFEDQRKLIPYPYKPQTYKHLRYPHTTQSPPIIQPYIDFDTMFNSPYPFPQGDYKVLPSNVIKTTRPAFLPTPVMPAIPISGHNKINFSTESITKLNTETTTKEPQFVSSYNKPKPTPVKVSYFADYVRPPVFNAPPGVFVTMDNKPFKPMPPLNFIPKSKSKPRDFRPSPQILDGQFSDTDSFPDSVFRPITLGFTNNSTMKSDIIDTSKKRKQNTSNTKPSKEAMNKKSQTTTLAPEIITANHDSFEEDDATEWVNLMGAFSKTTPMVSQKIKPNTTENIVRTSTTPITTTTAMKSEVVSITTTTVSSTKRTRPPPKFKKPNKIRKHKRVTTTTTTEAPNNITVKTTMQDLTPQASLTATKDKFSWKLKSTTLTTTSSTTLSSNSIATTAQSTTTTEQSTTAATTSTTKANTSTTTSTKSPILTSTTKTTTDVETPATTQPKYKNRYRQSTVMLKGTSIKHDKWNGLITEKNKSNLTYKPSRRNESNFHGYSSTTLRVQDIKQNKEESKQLLSGLLSKANDSSKQLTPETESTSVVLSEYENSVDQYTSSSEGPAVNSKENTTRYLKENQTKVNNEQNIDDQNEYIFNLTTTSAEKSNEIEDNILTTEQIITSPPQTVTRNKTRCKKKKNNSTMTAAGKHHNDVQHEITTIINNITTENSFSSGFFDELLRSFNTDVMVKEQTKKPQPAVKVKEESKSFEGFTNTDDDDDFGDILDSFEHNHKHDVHEKSEEIYQEDDTDSSFEHSPFNNDEENRAPRITNDEYADYQDHPFTLFELMAME